MFAISCCNVVVLVVIIGMGSGSAASLSRRRHDDSLQLEDFRPKVPLDQLDQDLREGEEEEEDASPALSDPAAATPATDSIPEEATTLAATTQMTWVTVAPPPVGRWRPAAIEIVAVSLGLGLLVCLGLYVFQLVAAKCSSGVVADVATANPPSASANIAAAAAAADPSPTESDSEQQPPQSHSRRAGCGPAVYYDCRLDDVHMDSWSG